ncbi:unnamed protein product, partial [Polarella glacialis]
EPSTSPADESQSAASSRGPSMSNEKKRWRQETFRAHEGGVFAISWAPAASSQAGIPGAASDSTGCGAVIGPRRLVTGGADHQVRIWRHDELTDEWADSHHFPAGEHGDWIRDVAWRPNVGMPTNTVASCSEDGSIVIWMQTMA